MDTAQLLLTIVIVVLTILLIVIGVQVFFILREFRKTVSKTNKILEDTGVITESISNPISNLSTLTSGLKIGSLIAKFLAGKKHGHHDNGERE
ncbi:MAG TPA: hypothetical protein VFQ63_03915 [Patescibacteria group bacterium]|nr:hypothetical protein [Patescibacteria group bacterium]